MGQGKHSRLGQRDAERRDSGLGDRDLKLARAGSQGRHASEHGRAGQFDIAAHDENAAALVFPPSPGEGKRPDEMLCAVRDFGRANPAALIAASVLAGIALGRLARASGDHVHAAPGKENGLASADTPDAFSEAGQVQPSDPGRQDLETAQPWAGAQAATPGAALAKTDSLSVLGDPESMGADDPDLAGRRLSGFRDDREV
ncbi:hypothetical protein BH10PSE3_BH10PSE3_01470 [soil metagenome]